MNWIGRENRKPIGSTREMLDLVKADRAKARSVFDTPRAKQTFQRSHGVTRRSAR